MPLNEMRNYILSENTRLSLELEKLRETTVLFYFFDILHRSVDDLQNIINQLKKDNKQMNNVDIILHSGGGFIDPAYHLTKMLNVAVESKLTFIVPRYAKSAATLLACGGDEILMGRSAELGPLDPQIDFDGIRLSALSVKATLKMLNQEIQDGNIEIATILANRLNALHLGEINSSLSISKKYLEEILKQRMFKNNQKSEKISSIAKNLTEGYTHHSYVIDINEAKRLGLNANLLNENEETIVWQIYQNNMVLSQLNNIEGQLNEYNTYLNLKRKRII